MSSAATTLTADAPAAPPVANSPVRFGATDVGLIGMAVIWGVNFSVVKVGLRVFDPFVFAAMRVIIASVVLFSIALSMRSVRWPSRQDTIALAGLGLIGNGAYQFLFLSGMSRTSAGIAALLIAAGPAWVAILLRVLGRERLPTRGWFGIALQLVGVACVVSSTHASGDGSNALLGAALIAVGSIMWAIFSVFLQPYTLRTHPLHVSAITMLSGAIVCVAVALPGMMRMDWSAPGRDAWGSVLYASLGAMVIAYLLYYRGIQVLGATRTAMYANLQPIIALGVAALILGEHPTGWQWLGASFIMGGLLVSRNASKRNAVVESLKPDRT